MLVRLMYFTIQVIILINFSIQVILRNVCMWFYFKFNCSGFDAGQLDGPEVWDFNLVVYWSGFEAKC
jgi:hypothetical protein